MGARQRLVQMLLRRYGSAAVDWLSREENRGYAAKVLGLSLKAHGYNNFRTLEESGEAHLIASLGRIGALGMCFDVGANTGEYATRLLDAGADFVHGYEPHPAQSEALRRIVENHPDRFLFYSVAVADVEGSADLHFNPEALSHASMAEEVNSISYVNNLESVTVPVVTIDAEMQRLGLADVDFIKIDTEGFESEVLTGASRTIRDRPPKAIQIEFNMHQLARRHTLLSLSRHVPDFKCFQLLRGQHGVRAVEPAAPDANVFHFSNFVFVRGDIVPALLEASQPKR